MSSIDKQHGEKRVEIYNDARMRIDPWIDRLNSIGKVDRVDIRDLQTVFEFWGANIEISSEEKKILSEYMPGEASDGMEVVWGDRKLDEFDAFRTRWIADYNLKEGNRRLPKTPSREIGTGMKRFFLELTQLSLGVLEVETFTVRTEAAFQNGKLWQAKKDDERIKMVTPKSKGKAIRVAELPPGFILDFYGWLRTKFI